MRVLEVARQFYPRVGGIESCVLNLSRGLTGRGHSVEVVTLDRDLRDRRPIESPASIDSIPIHRVPFFGSSRYPIAPGWFRFGNNFDVVHIHAIDFFVDSAALARRLGLLRKPVIVTTHGGIFHTPAWPSLKTLYWNSVLKSSLGAVATVVAVSDHDARLFASIVPPEKLATIPNGIDPRFPAAARAATQRRTLITFGRVTKTKRIDQIIELFGAVAADFPDLDLIVAGPDENETIDTLRSQSERLGLAERIRFTGALPGDQLAALVASGTLFISAAPHEGFGITTVEALSAGIPVLVTRTGVHDQIVEPGRNGWFWSGVSDTNAVATLREALLLPVARIDALRAAARESAAPFDWSLTTEKYERVLESAYRKSLG